jgi:hypothetical protein
MANTTIPVELSSTPGIVDNSNATAITIDSSENVGIGTGSPQRPLHINGTEGVARFTSTASGNDGFEVGIGASSQAFLWQSENSYIQFATNNTERLRIDSSGFVGIECTPDAWSGYSVLQIGTSGALSANEDITFLSANAYSSATGWKYVTTDEASLYQQIEGGHIWYGASSGSADAAISWSESMRIDNNGNIRINNTSTNVNDRVIIQGNSTAASGNSLVVADSAGADLFNVRNDGAIYTGGGANSARYLTTATAANLVVETDGYLYKSTSSRRYKNTITDATHGLTELLTLRPVTYKGNGKIDGDTVFGGLIAEEVHDAGLTEFVVYNEENEPDALAYSNMVSLCVKAIQEQQALIESLTARITALES